MQISDGGCALHEYVLRWISLRKYECTLFTITCGSFAKYQNQHGEIVIISEPPKYTLFHSYNNHAEQLTIPRGLTLLSGECNIRYNYETVDGSSDIYCGVCNNYMPARQDSCAYCAAARYTLQTVVIPNVVIWSGLDFLPEIKHLVLHTLCELITRAPPLFIPKIRPSIPWANIRRPGQ